MTSFHSYDVIREMVDDLNRKEETSLDSLKFVLAIQMTEKTIKSSFLFLFSTKAEQSSIYTNTYDIYIAFVEKEKKN